MGDYVVIEDYSEEPHFLYVDQILDIGKGWMSLGSGTYNKKSLKWVAGKRRMLRKTPKYTKIVDGNSEAGAKLRRRLQAIQPEAKP